MKNRTKERAITLISLTVTIIVLFILAGISIAMAVKNTGILENTNLSKYNSIKKTASEQVELACSAVRIVMAEASAKDNSYSAIKNSDLIQNKVIEILNLDITNLLGQFDYGDTPALENQKEFTIEYAGEDCENAKIIFTIELSQKTIELIKEEIIEINNEEIPDDNLIDNDREIIKDMYTDANRRIMIVLFMTSLMCLVIILCVVIFLLTKSIKKKDKLSKAGMIKQKARTNVKTVCDSIKVSKIRKNNPWNDESVNLVQNILIEKLNDNKTDLDGNFKNDGSSFVDEHYVIKAFYEGEDYKKACNDVNARITYIIVLEEDELNLIKENSTVLSEEKKK